MPPIVGMTVLLSFRGTRNPIEFDTDAANVRMTAFMAVAAFRHCEARSNPILQIESVAIPKRMPLVVGMTVLFSLRGTKQSHLTYYFSINFEKQIASCLAMTSIIN
jgi:hypothetical protein